MIDLDTVDVYNLDDWFIEQFGLGNKTKEVNGYTIQKTMYKFSSNSGKSHDWNIVYRITAPSGDERKLEKESSYAKNRSHDPNRNYGLHE